MKIYVYLPVRQQLRRKQLDSGRGGLETRKALVVACGWIGAVQKCNSLNSKMTSDIDIRVKYYLQKKIITHVLVACYALIGFQFYVNK